MDYIGKNLQIIQRYVLKILIMRIWNFEESTLIIEFELNEV